MKYFKLLLFIALGLIGVSFLIIPILGILLGTPFADIKTAVLSREVVNSIILTLFSGLISTIIGIVIGIPIAYLIAFKDFRGKGLLESIIDVPVMIPHTAAGIALLSVFGSRGLLGNIFSVFGIKFVGTIGGIIIGMMFVSITYLINASKEGFKSIDRKYIKASMTLGANEFGTFFHIILPLSFKDIISGSIMSWARAISEFGAIVILAYHPMIAPVLIYERFSTYGLKYSRPVVFLIIVISLIIFIILRIISNKMKNFRDK